MKRLPRWIQGRVTVGGQPASGIAIATSIKTTRKNPFDFIWGPSDTDGMVVIQGADLLRQGEADVRMFAMDYGHPERDGAGRIEVLVEDVDSLSEAIKAYDRFAAGYEYPAGYRAMLIEAKRRTAKLGVAPTLSLEFDGGDCAVVSTPRRAAG